MFGIGFGEVLLAAAAGLGTAGAAKLVKRGSSAVDKELEGDRGQVTPKPKSGQVGVSLASG